MEARTETIETELENGQHIHVEAVALRGEEVLADFLPFEEVTNAIEGIAKTVVATLEKVKPHKATVEFGIQIAIDSGKLTAVVVKGDATANLKITLEWEELASSTTQSPQT
jgi:Trypsin-co-occurring domain 1